MKKYIFLLLLSFQGLLAQVQFDASVSKTSLGINERLRVDFTMNEDGDNFSPPAFEGFRVVGGPNQAVSYSWMNGKKSFNKSFSYFLMPLKKGTLVIKQASIEIEGKIYKTAPIKVTITNAVQEEVNPYNPQQKMGEGIHLVAEISKTNPYINEPITVVYKLYVSNTASVRNWREMASPKYNDFWSQNIDIKKLVVENGKYNGEDYRYVVLRKTVLYPQKAGKLEIEPLSLDIEVDLPTGRRDFFGRMEYASGNKTVSAGAKSISVRSLPEAGKPVDFSGAVGDFDFKVTPSKTTLKSGESLDLVVSVSGKGNLKLFNLPKPVVPSALEMYDPEHKEKVNTPLSGMQGEITDTYTIIPQYKGNYQIKPMVFSYFDWSANAYKTITSKEIMVNVLDGPMPTSGDPQVASAEGKQNVVANDQFQFIKLKTNLTAVAQKDFLGSGFFYSLLLAPFLIIPVIVLAKKKKEAIDGDVAGNKIRQSNKLAKKFLSEANKQLGSKEAFYVAMEKALHNFLKAKLHIETSEMSKENIRELLLSKKAAPDTVQNFIALMDSCEFARYTPASVGTMQQDYDKAVTVISGLEKQINN
ncbi:MULTISPECIES: BatD family protein [unclassified Flavobacterium]|uniref:BatD family protein n=1 Tax=unclassified Flavobacterium TaxID=196869 RepID=UPI00086AFD48|nr:MULTISPECIES: BatD family protein [unclassified Flavobacterium]MBN9284614.1 protein BatD [Flavobacterium sp.]ODS85936.1 MAG: BatD protein [Chryseobacterium sp. SCN 40-13]OJV72637.1 MAG: BatD protein [Flavobacterium sp. 40-81]